MRIQAAALFAAITPITTAWAANAKEIRVVGGCWALTGDGFAAFETRVKVDLSLRAPSGGDLQLSCDASSAHLAWRPAFEAAPVREIFIPIDTAGAPPVGFLEDLLEAAARLASEPAPPAPQPPIVQPEPIPPATSNAPEAASAVPVVPQPPVATGAPRDELPPSPLEPPARSGGLRLAAATGGVATTLSGDGIGAAGPLVGLFVGGPALYHWTFGTSGSFLFSGRRIDAVSTRIAELAVHIDRALDERERWLLGAAVAGGSFTATGDGSVNPDSRQTSFLSIAIRGGYVAKLEPISLLIAPELRFYAEPVSVSIGGAERFGTGRFGAALTIAATLPVLGRDATPVIAKR